MSRFKHREATITDNSGNTVRVRALTAGERQQVASIAKEDASRLPYFLVACSSQEPKLSEAEARDMPSDLLDALCQQVMEWANPPGGEKKASARTSSSAVE